MEILSVGWTQIYRQNITGMNGFAQMGKGKAMDDLISRQTAINAAEESRRCNPHKEGKVARNHEYEHRHFIALLRSLPSAQPIIRCKNCKHRDSNDCPMYYEEWIEIDEGDGYFDTDNIIHDWTTDEGFCHCAELRGEQDD